MSYEWEYKKTMISVESHCYGFMAVTPAVSEEGYRLTHIGIGYAMHPSMVNVDECDHDGCKKAIKAIVDGVPEAEDLFLKMVARSLSRPEENTLKLKIINVVNKGQSQKST